VYDSIIRKKKGKYNYDKDVLNNRREREGESSGKKEKSGMEIIGKKGCGRGK
jgi:hypothetical protein